ncbi:MAG: VWA domain-containing protein [Clostridia bacterium]|nr:VWA domain-containing protein [Clostridia bacterium]
MFLNKRVLMVLSLVLSFLMMLALTACAFKEDKSESEYEAAGDYYDEPSEAGAHARTTSSGSSRDGGQMPDEEYVGGDAFVLTAGEWNDNENWPFFSNLVTSGTITFPSYGIDPRGRIKLTLTDETGAPLEGETASLSGADGVLWTAKTDRNGIAYLFFGEGETPETVSALDQTVTLSYEAPSGDTQQSASSPASDEVSITGAAQAAKKTSLQVMFIVDTTGSMGDEIAFLQKDFAAIASDAGSNGVEYSACFYRDEGDEYVTKVNGFTSDLGEVSALIMAEYADGGGDLPEAVAQILDETITENTAWNDDARKIAFLIFDAPPHSQYDAVIDKAVRAAAEKGIMVVPVVASNADRDTELFGRALAICTNGTYVFLTDDSGVGESHLEPIVGDYTVELLHDIIVRIINENKI